MTFLKTCPVPVIVLQRNEIADGVLFYQNTNDYSTLGVQYAQAFSALEADGTAPGALVAESLKKRCVQQDSTTVFWYDNLPFQVHAFYPDGALRYSSYAALTSMLEQNLEAQWNGTLYLDAGEQTQTVCDALHEQVMEKTAVSDFSVQPVGSDVSAMAQGREGDQKQQMLILAVAAAVLLLNLYQLVAFWFWSREKELSLRMLSGAPPARLCRETLLTFFVGVGSALTVGGGSAWLAAVAFDFPAGVGGAAAGLCSFLFLTLSAGLGGVLLCSRFYQYIRKNGGT